MFKSNIFGTEGVDLCAILAESKYLSAVMPTVFAKDDMYCNQGWKDCHHQLTYL